MAVTSGFFNSVNHDRLYNAEQISSMFDGIILDGIYQGLGDAFIVKPYSELNCTVTVGTGRAWFDHTWTLNSTELALTLDDPNVLYDRIDAIVIDVDRRQDVRANSIKVVKGTVSEHGATKPSLIEEELHNQYPLAYVTVKAGSAAPIQAQYIENVIGQTKTPLVAGVLDHMDITMFVQQMEDEFNVWFEGLKDVVSGDSITNLQQQINELSNNSLKVKESLKDIIKNGNPDFGISSVTLSNDGVGGVSAMAGSQTYIFDTLSESGPYNQSFILPDGKIARIGMLIPEDSATSTGTSDNRPYDFGVGGFNGAEGCTVVFYVKITTEDGVTQSYTSTAKVTSNAYNSYSSQFTYPLIVTNIDADTYPVTLQAIVPTDLAINDYDRLIAHTFVSTITINSDGSVSFNSSGTARSAIINESSVAWVTGKCTLPAFTSNGDSIFLDFSEDECFAYRVSSDGVVTYGSNTRFDDSFGSTSSIMPLIKNYSRAYNVGTNSYSSVVIGKASSNCIGGVRVDNSSLAVSNPVENQTSAPSNYRTPYKGEYYNLTAGNILKKKSWNETSTSSDSTVGRFISPAFSMGLSLVTTANLVFVNDYEDVKMAILINSGSNSRCLYYDETDKVGVYDYLFTQAPSSVQSLTPFNGSRNKYRSRQIGNKLYMLFDNASSIAKLSKREDTVTLIILGS